MWVASTPQCRLTLALDINIDCVRGGRWNARCREAGDTGAHERTRRSMASFIFAPGINSSVTRYLEG